MAADRSGRSRRPGRPGLPIQALCGHPSFPPSPESSWLPARRVRLPTRNENHTAKFRVRKRRAGAYHWTGARAARSPQPLQPPGYSPPKSSLPSSRALFIFETLGVLLPALRPGSRSGARWSSETGTAASSPRSSRPTVSTSAAGWCRLGGLWRTGGTRRITSTPRTKRARPSVGCGGAPS